METKKRLCRDDGLDESRASLRGEKKSPRKTGKRSLPLQADGWATCRYKTKCHDPIIDPGVILILPGDLIARLYVAGPPTRLGRPDGYYSNILSFLPVQ